jgi:curli biogenesis system outer membrane secretion channel CsgG
VQTYRARTVLVVMSFALAAPALFVPGAAAQSTESRPTLAIVDFEAAPGGWTIPPPRLGNTAAQLMLDRLVASARFHVLDGQWLERGNGFPRTPATLDRLRADAGAAGVDYLIFGSITRFSTENKQRTLGGAAVILPVLAGLRRQRNEMVIALTVRAVDVRSGEVVATATGEGKATRSKLALGGLGLARAGGLSSGASDSRDAQLDEAIQRSVAAASDGLAKATFRFARPKAEAAGAPVGVRDR